KDTGCFLSTLIVDNNDVLVRITIRGCGIQPQIQAPLTIDFGAVRLDTCKDTSFTITNIGNDTLTITKETFGDGRFSAIQASFPIIIGPGRSKTITLRFCA